MAKTIDRLWRIVRDTGGSNATEWDPYPEQRFATELEGEEYVGHLSHSTSVHACYLFVMHMSDVPITEGGTGYFPVLDRRRDGDSMWTEGELPESVRDGRSLLIMQRRVAFRDSVVGAKLQLVRFDTKAQTWGTSGIGNVVVRPIVRWCDADHLISMFADEPLRRVDAPNRECDT